MMIYNEHWERYKGEIPEFNCDTFDLLICVNGEVAKAFIFDGEILSWDGTVDYLTNDEVDFWCLIEKPSYK